MRARNIKPGFFRDADLLELPLEARYLFMGLWCMADRDGKLEDKPKQIKIEVFGERLKVDCSKLLKMLTERQLIFRYGMNGENYIHIKNFLKHQSPHHTEAKSKFPDPPVSHGELTVSHGEYPPDSLIHRFTDLKDNVGKKADNVSDFLNTLAETWNETRPKELPGVTTPFKRPKAEMDKLKNLINGKDDLEWWRHLFGSMKGRPYTLGQNDRGWKASFDYVLKNADKLADGHLLVGVELHKPTCPGCGNYADCCICQEKPRCP